MFVGHFALAFGAKRLAPTASLGTLFLAAQFADLLWPSLVLAGVELFEIAPGDTVVTPLHFIYYPWSHSLVALAAWGALFALLHRALRRDSVPGAALVVGALVLSHWVLDVVSHRADMPIDLRSDALVGLGLWNSLPATLLVELTLFAVGVALYARATEAIDRIGARGLWALVAFLVVIHAANLFGPPPPSIEGVAWTAQSMWLLVAWGWWVDRHRRARTPAERGG